MRAKYTLQGLGELPGYVVRFDINLEKENIKHYGQDWEDRHIRYCLWCSCQA